MCYSSTGDSGTAVEPVSLQPCETGAGQCHRRNATRAMPQEQCHRHSATGAVPLVQCRRSSAAGAVPQEQCYQGSATSAAWLLRAVELLLCSHSTFPIPAVPSGAFSSSLTRVFTEDASSEMQPPQLQQTNPHLLILMTHHQLIMFLQLQG